MRVIVMDGQGGKMGKLLIEGVRAAGLPCELVCVGTNSIATSAMIKAGASAGATGANAVLVASREADVIIGPIGILVADALLGEVSPAMAVAVGRSKAKKLLLPVSLCNNLIVGVSPLPLAKLIAQAVDELAKLIHECRP